MEFSFNSVHYLYNYYMVCALFLVLRSCVISLEKKRKENINNDLAILPSHDTFVLCHTALIKSSSLAYYQYSRTT